MGGESCCARYCSPVRWVAGFTNLLLQFVGQKTILFFIVLEAVLCCFLGYFIYMHQKVAPLGVFIRSWKSYEVLTGFRLAVAIFGFIAVYSRRIQLTKVFYGLFFTAAFVACWTVIPVVNLKCKCVDFLQCSALGTFADKSAHFTNPYWEPDYVGFEGKRHVPYHEPPTKPDEATAFQEELYAAANKNKATAQEQEEDADSSAIQLAAAEEHGPHGGQDDTAMVVESMAYGHGRLVQKRRIRHSTLEPEGHAGRLAPAASSIQLDAEGGGTHAEAFDPVTMLKPLVSKTTAETKVRKKAQTGIISQVSKHPMHFFNISEKGLSWVSTEPPWCENKTVSARDAKKFQMRLATASWDEDAILDEFLSSKLFICAIDSTCGAVSAEVLQAFYGTIYKVCQHSLQMVPVSAANAQSRKEGVPQLVGPNGTWFQRNPISLRKHLEATNAAPAGFYQYAFRTLEPSSGIKLLKGLQKNQCTCDPKEGGCKTYKDALGGDRFWCYVKASRRQRCVEEGIQMFWDAKATKIWSSAICQKAGCTCSGIGMHPADLKEPDINTSKLSMNRLNYGSYCRDWSKGTNTNWCYVGWDSICPDRGKASNYWVSRDYPYWPTMPHQYFSSQPCDPEVQAEVRELTSEFCTNRKAVIEVILLIELLLFLPMTVIIFKFLSNRCGDEFPTEEQFAVVLSTDEESDTEEDSNSKAAGAGAAGASGAGAGGDGDNRADPKSGGSPPDAGARP